MRKLAGVTIVGALGSGFLAFLALGMAGGPGSPTAAALGEADTGACYELVVPLSSVMEVMDDVFAKMPERVKSGSRRDFRALKREAEFVAEIGNLAGRIDEHCKNKDWVALANQMKTVALGMAEAAGKAEAEAFNKLYDQAKSSCSSCHDKFRD